MVEEFAAERRLAIGMFLWVLALAAFWPLSLSFADEVGYVGQAKLLLEGHMRPLPDSPGVWVVTPQGPIPQYPLLVPLLIMPLLAVTPRLVFISGVLAALGIVWVASRALRAWGRSPQWALIVLAHPTVVIVARTVMSDLLLAAFAVGAWWAIRRDRRITTLVLLLLLVATKPTGFLIALALVVGEAAHMARAILARDRAAFVRLGWASAGLAIGLMAAMALNLATSGKLWFAYNHSFLGTPPFWPVYFPTTAPRHVASLLLMPPLLLGGLWPFWRRRDYGPLLVIGGFGLMMCFYFFVDTGRNGLETLILSPRLILPVVAFLLIGYADGLATLAARFGKAASPPHLFAALLMVAPALVAVAISARHRRWQEPNAAALAATSDLTATLGVHELGLNAAALKAGLLYPGHTALVRGARNAPEVVLCKTRSPSYRAPDERLNCDLPGYEERLDITNFRVLVRRR